MALYRGNGGSAISSAEGTYYASEAQKFAQQSQESANVSATKATEASTSATNAKTSETNAKTSETNAKTSETNSKTSETNSKTSETNASTSATNASNSATLAQQWATKTDAEVVAGQGFGAKKYADEAAATLASKANDAAVVHNTGDETIGGIKTFSSSPIVPTPVVGDDSTNVASTAWVRDIIIGIVSQTSGNPTGALFEEVVNANGTALKFANGFMICMHRVTPAYVNNYAANTTWTFPVAFQTSTVPYSFAQRRGNAPGAVDVLRAAACRTEDNTKATAAWLVTDAANLLSSTSFMDELTVFAIGRWF